jgi:hypothetical protein
VNDRPGVSYYSISSTGSSDGVAYRYDTKTDSTVSVAAIYKLVETRTADIVLDGGVFLQSFEVLQEDIDKLEI